MKVVDEDGAAERVVRTQALAQRGQVGKLIYCGHFGEKVLKTSLLGARPNITELCLRE